MVSVCAGGCSPWAWFRTRAFGCCAPALPGPWVGQGDLTPLVQTVRRWWFEADAWRDPAAQREFLARVERYQREGPPPPAERVTRQEIRARYGV
ncbi:MAG TPA: DUF6247 family protein [Streptosporangiaceae bacterium]